MYTTELAQYNFSPSINPLRNNSKYQIYDLSSKGENCGLYALSLCGFLDEEDFPNFRQMLNFPDGRLSLDDLAKIVCDLYNHVLIGINMEINSSYLNLEPTHILFDNVGIDLYVPECISESNVNGSVILLNEQGHFSLATREDNKFISPDEIIKLYKSLPKSRLFTSSGNFLINVEKISEKINLLNN